ncbi:hypothetical protein EG328_010543 [Venturia inaequalis]|uniref:Transcription factor domain-containing protein n=1 Tax=Venturia inaequalis TaxID=5025 RepID=A0A8H3VKG5_VENIN|nr:hypothetical protein EG328_010543 [Venturia inaequalis]
MPRKYIDEDLIIRLESQVESLKYEVMQYRRIYAPKEFPGGSGLASKTILDDVQERGLDSTSKDASSSPFARGQSGENRYQTPADAVDVRSQTAMEDLASLMLTMDIEDRGEPSFMIPSAKMRPSDHINPSMSHSSHQLQHAASELQRFPSSDPQSIIRKDLIQDFTNNFNIFHHFLESGDPIHTSIDEPKQGGLDLQFRNHALYAVATHFSKLPNSVDLGVQYAEFAESIVLRCMRETPNDLVSQGLTLLAWRELMLGNDSMAYNYIGKTSHVLLLITASLGMNCTMHWQRVKSPSFLTILERSPTLDELAHDQFCQLWHLWDSCMDQVYAFGWSDLSSDERNRLVTRSHDALEDFYRQVDDRFKIRNMGDSVSASIIWFNVAYHAAVLLIHRPFLNEPAGSFTLNFAMRCATSAAASISNIVRYSKSAEFCIVAPQVIDYIMSASVVHLLNATSGRTALGRQSANGLKSCMNALTYMQPKWNSRVQLSVRRIQELAHKWEVVWALPLQVSQPLEQQQQQPQPSKESDCTTTETCFVSGSGGVPYDTANFAEDTLADNVAFGMSSWNMDQYESALANVPTDFQENWNFDFLFDQNGNLVDL